MTDEPLDPLANLVAIRDQYMTTYRSMFIPMFKELNQMMKAEGLEIEIRAAVIDQAHKKLTDPIKT